LNLAGKRLYIALYQEDGREVEGLGYARQEIALRVLKTGPIVNAKRITFGPAAPQSPVVPAWGRVTHAAVVTSPYRGEGVVILYATLSRQYQVMPADIVEFEAGNFVFRVNTLEDAGIQATLATYIEGFAKH
jgi:hypothetical protein